ncbi:MULTISPECIES: HlyD family efflux transporter periplasmic adaptor subunit [unclassified Paenibacillus]|uniref:HlyD family secretion protein n=1 Tax=unclassified Paenibacillus TaxID=185978 RepID=UPI001AEAAD04|nr:MULTISPECIES: HlyD family efflux transporter periplasmic adaptor subunit [unclassified Paenibacillus]MBP1155366.1 HlyD family secretion protein [Paenibacillus sp. PvP091]MBP1169250.1 HlyD family secretion protein [Paenibacillus sp. PvR098]MBP2440277.1 HlyD family secretion protein [Paenibacillus sp. PvP052]
MRFIRPMIYILMAAAIGMGGYLLSTKQTTAGSTQGGSPGLSTAYIETNSVSASFKLGGRITEILVHEGDTVKKGQVLARLQSSELEAKVAQANAAVALAQGKIAEAQGAKAAAQAKKEQAAAGVTLTAGTVEQQIAQAKAAVDAAQAKVDGLHNGSRPEEKKQAEIQYQAAKEVYDIAEQNLNRMNALLEEGLVSKADVDKTKVNYREAQTKFELAEQQLSMANQGPREEEVRAAEALLEQAKATLQLAEAGREQVAVRQGDAAAADAAIKQAQGALQSAASGEKQAQAAQAEAQVYVGYTELIAPSDGVILSQTAQPGELVGSGFPVFTIQATDTPWAKFYMTEISVAEVKTGDKVRMKLIATGQEVEGTVLSVSAAPDFAIKKATQNAGEADVRSFAVKVVLPQIPQGAAVGMTLQWIGTTEG